MATRNSQHKGNSVDQFFDNLNAFFDSEDAPSVAKVAAAVGISRQHLYEVKDRRSKPSFELVAKLTEVMGGKIEFDFPKILCKV